MKHQILSLKLLLAALVICSSLQAHATVVFPHQSGIQVNPYAFSPEDSIRGIQSAASEAWAICQQRGGSLQGFQPQGQGLQGTPYGFAVLITVAAVACSQ